MSNRWLDLFSVKIGIMVTSSSVKLLKYNMFFIKRN